MKHQAIKRKIKVLGAVSLAVGLLCAIIGLVDFFGAMSREEPPSLFYLLFIGFPLIGIGGSALAFGFREEILRYHKNESLPIIKEVGSELAPTVRDIADACREEESEARAATLVCSCGVVNSAGSRFCKECGRELMRKCPQCGASVAADCKFCTQCGCRFREDLPGQKDYAE